MAGEGMMYPQYHYDDQWGRIDIADLKRIALFWGGDGTLRKKEACIDFLRTRLADVNQVDATLKRMRPYELAALGILKTFGSLEYRVLKVVIRTTGTMPADADPPRSAYNSYSQDEFRKLLTGRGIVMADTNRSPYSYGGNPNDLIFTDARILARVAGLKPVPFSIKGMEKGTEQPPTATFRRPQSVMLDVLSLLNAVDSIGGIGLTKAGVARVTELRKLVRKIGWSDEIFIDGLRFPDPANAFILVLTEAGLLKVSGEAIVVSRLGQDTAQRSVIELSRALMKGVVPARTWCESMQTDSQYQFYEYLSAARMILVTALHCLPKPDAWYRFEAFTDALYGRIGEYYSIDGVRSQPYMFQKTPEQQEQMMATWRKGVRADWEENDRPWIQAVFKTWLYAFGLVELGLKDGNVETFRLTELGQAVVSGESGTEDSQRSQLASKTEKTAPAWVVQPNFEVMVYLENTRSEQIAFLERHAERVSVAQHTAQYRLTRESVYEGLERGGDVDSLIEGLASNARVALPSNVVAEIRTWATLRERITLRRRADLMEFPDSKARQRALDEGIVGQALGDRFLLLSAPLPAAKLDSKLGVIDYEKPPLPDSLEVTEEGVITLSTQHSKDKKRPDLLTQGYLNLWAEQEKGMTWRLTRQSIANAVKHGRTVAELNNILRTRINKGLKDLPGLLNLALRAWGKESIPVSLAEVVVIQCPQSPILTALVGSKSLRPYLLGSLGFDTLLVRRADVKKVRAILEWAGIQLSDTIIASKFPSETK